MKKTFKVISVFILVASWLLTGWPPLWLGPKFPSEIREAKAADTGFKTTTTTAAVTSNAGDNNGFETTYGSNTPKDTTTDNAAGLASANTSSGAATDGCTTFPQTEDDQHDFYNFGFSIPAGSTVNGIEILTHLLVSSNSGTNLFCYALSYNNGANWTAAKSSGDIGTSETPVTLGGAADNWGRTWAPTDFNNANFRIRVMLDPSATLTYTFSMDLLQVKVYYTTETNPPTPNPMTFATAPGNDSTSQISMVATTATDDFSGPVNYLFTNDNSTCGTDAGNGGTSSSWQAGTSYSDSGLDVNKCYGYTVTAEDSATPPNVGTASSIAKAYTSANTPGTPTLNGATASTLNLTNAENGNPAANPETSFAVQVVTTTPTDNNWLNKWVDATGNPSASAVWLSDAQLDATVLQNLAMNTTYGAKVKAKNQDGDETALSLEGQGTTTAATSSFTQNDFEWFEDEGTVTLTNAWSLADLIENQDIRALPFINHAPASGDKIRMQINVTVGTADLPATTQAFKLQYKAGTDENCSTGSWTDVGVKGTSATHWVFYDNASLADTTSEVNQISTSDVAGGYSEVNPTAANPNAVTSGLDMEWDFPIVSVSGQVVDAATYAFRMVKSDGTAINYTAGDCPTIETEPGLANLMRHGNMYIDQSEKGFFWSD